MEQRMTFDIDRTTVTEGDVVEVRWNCTGADRVELKIDNGYKASVLPLDINGTKRFRLNRSKGRTALTITAWKDGKHGSKTIRVRVKEMPTTHAETVDQKGRTMGPIRQWWQQTRPRLQAMPAEKRIAMRTMAILAILLLVSSFLPVLFGFGVIALMFYLLYIILKK